MFTTTAAVTLALGIGANTTIFAGIRAVALRPLPFPEDDRLITAYLVVVETVTDNYFHVFGVRPLLGRAFRPEETVTPRGDRFLILGHDLWRRESGGDPAVVGSSVVAQQDTVRGRRRDAAAILVAMLAVATFLPRPGRRDRGSDVGSAKGVGAPLAFRAS